MSAVDIVKEDFIKPSILPTATTPTATPPPVDWLQKADTTLKTVDSILARIQTIQNVRLQALTQQPAQNNVVNTPQTEVKKTQPTNTPAPQTSTVKLQINEENVVALLSELVNLSSMLPDQIKDSKVAALPALYQQNKALIDGVVVNNLKTNIYRIVTVKQ